MWPYKCIALAAKNATDEAVAGLREVLATGQDAGVWGGTSEEERRSIRRARRREMATARRVAVDLTHGMLTAARRRDDSLELIQADGAALPLRSGSIDLVASAQAFHHIRAPLPVLMEMRRVAGEGGRVLVVSHGGAIAGALCGWLGRPLNAIWTLRLDNASITRVILPAGQLLGWNETGHLDGAPAATVAP